MPLGYDNLIFEDNFTNLDKNVWSLRGQAYVPGTMHAKSSWEAVKISGGKLRLFATPVFNGNFINGHIGTEASFSFTYGFAEARMRVHPYLGSHCSFWLQSQQPYGVGRPEIDVVEYFGVKNPGRRAPTNAWQNVYYRDDNEGPLLNWRSHVEDSLDTRWSNDFHNYGVEWTPDGYTFYIDRIDVGFCPVGQSDVPKYLILSMLTRDYEIADYQLDKADTYKLSVESVRVWQ